MSARDRFEAGLRPVITLAAIAIASRWEIGYAHALGLGLFAWGLPLLTSGYLVLALSRGRDVAAALGALWVSVVLGAVSAVVELPRVYLAVWTGTLVAAVVYRSHAIDHEQLQAEAEDEDEDDAVEPVEPDRSRPVAPTVLEQPRPVAVAAPVELLHRPDASGCEVDLEAAFSRRYAVRPMTVDEVHAARGGSRDSARAWHRRMTIAAERAEQQAAEVAS
jgi:hypothetical protein